MNHPDQIELKTAGELIDALITCRIKFLLTDPNKDPLKFTMLHERCVKLNGVIGKRVTKGLTMAQKVEALVSADYACFQAQDKITDIDPAAREAQDMNKKRCEAIRALDYMLGEGDFTVTEKTY